MGSYLPSIKNNGELRKPPKFDDNPIYSPVDNLVGYLPPIEPEQIPDPRHTKYVDICVESAKHAADDANLVRTISAAFDHKSADVLMKLTGVDEQIERAITAASTAEASRDIAVTCADIARSSAESAEEDAYIANTAASNAAASSTRASQSASSAEQSASNAHSSSNTAITASDTARAAADTATSEAAIAAASASTATSKASEAVTASSTATAASEAAAASATAAATSENNAEASAIRAEAAAEDVEAALSTKQDKLIAGTNIKIEGNVISVIGGSGTSTYDDLSNLPSLDGVTIIGDHSLDYYDIASKSNLDELSNIVSSANDILDTL